MPGPAVHQCPPARHRMINPPIPPDQHRPIPKLHAPPRNHRTKIHRRRGPEGGEGGAGPGGAGFDEEPAFGRWGGRDQGVSAPVGQRRTARLRSVSFSHKSRPPHNTRPPHNATHATTTTPRPRPCAPRQHASNAQPPPASRSRHSAYCCPSQPIHAQRDPRPTRSTSSEIHLHRDPRSTRSTFY
jgi:hypothetical protein